MSKVSGIKVVAQGVGSYLVSIVMNFQMSIQGGIWSVVNMCCIEQRKLG